MEVEEFTQAIGLGSQTALRESEHWQNMRFQWLQTRMQVPADRTENEEVMKYPQFKVIVSYTWIMKPSLVNVFEGSWTRLDAGFGGVVESADGKPFCLSNIINIVEPGQCYINGVAAANGFGTPSAQPYTYHRVSWGLSDSLTKTAGNHLLSAGVNAYHQLAHEISSWPAYPGVYFSGGVTGLGLADFLLGDVATYMQGGGEVKRRAGLADRSLRSGPIPCQPLPYSHLRPALGTHTPGHDRWWPRCGLRSRTTQ